MYHGKNKISMGRMVIRDSAREPLLSLLSPLNRPTGLKNLTVALTKRNIIGEVAIEDPKHIIFISEIDRHASRGLGRGAFARSAVPM